MGQSLFVIIAGPSGVGKTTVMNKLRERGHQFHKVITATTRSPRPGEEHGREYFFLSEQEFDQMLRDEKLLEHAEVFGKRYGVPADQVLQNLEAGRDVFLITDVKGAATIRAKMPEVVSLFLKPTSLSQIEKRVRSREVDPDAINRRLSEAKVEMSRANEFTHTIVNRIGKIEETLLQIERLLDNHRSAKFK